MMPVHRDTLNAVAMAEQDGDTVSLAKWCREGLGREDALREQLAAAKATVAAQNENARRAQEIINGQATAKPHDTLEKET